MNITPLFLGISLLTTLTSGDVIFDQIGPMDGSGVGLEGYVSQDFDSFYDPYDIIAAENVSVSSSSTITSTETVLKGWWGFLDPSSITNYQINFYSSPEAAGNDLIGDVLSLNIDPADVDVSTAWLGEGYLVSLPVEIQLNVGDYYFGVLSTNQFPIYGQVGIAESVIGDGQSAIWANPDNGFGNGYFGEIPFELAYRLSNNPPPDPCDEPLSYCAIDIDGDGIVAVGDILSIIANWGQCGDGTFRPLGDVAPAPNGDCCVDVTDILAVIAQWGYVYDCTPIGACCFEEGTCTDDMRQPDCETEGGLFLGEDSYCIFEDCGVGACCTSETECIENVTAWYCGSLSGEFKGNDTTCDAVSCMLLGDECENAIEVFAGANPFDTTLMTPSMPEPSNFGNDDGQNWDCFSNNFDWNQSRDGWYKYIPLDSGTTLFSTCDIDSYDTSIALYKGGCYPTDQVRCNGDSELDGTQCQYYFSSIDYYVTAGEVYYIRIGSWNGEFVGAGTLTISPPETGIGACCLDGSCQEDWDAAICVAIGGEFMGKGSTCEPGLCDLPDPPANDHCSTASELLLGQNSFDTSLATPSSLQVDDSQCAKDTLNWCYNEEGSWTCSPDIWFYYQSTATETIRFSTCDAESYDTSIVLYQNECNDVANQVACNGDANNQTGCQQYYSSIEYDLIEGETYYLRVGGWKGATGIGTITVSPVGAGAFGACCVLGDCVGDTMTEKECQALAGSWYMDAYCNTVVCEAPLCPNATVSQRPYTYDDPDWKTRTSADDPTNGFYYIAAANVQVDSMSRFTVWGLEAFYTGTEWVVCDGINTFNVTTYVDDGSGLPGATIDQQLSITPTRTGTGEYFFNTYELFSYEFDFATGGFDHISVQSNSDGIGCYFLWMGSPEGDAVSAFNTGSGWYIPDPSDIADLSICIE